MQHYIYVIKNETTGEYYIGKRSSADYTQDTYMGSGKLLQLKMKAHPDHQWTKEVLMLLDSADEAYEMEKHLIGDRWLTDSCCLNLVAGGKGGGLTETQLIHRKELQQRWEREEDLGVTLLGLSHDGERVTTRVAVGCSMWRDQVAQLLKRGFVFGYVTAYRRVTLASLGLNIQKTSLELKELWESGATIASTSLIFSHAAEQVQTRVHTTTKDWRIQVALLLERGFTFGRVSRYRKVSLSSLGLAVPKRSASVTQQILEKGQLINDRQSIMMLHEARQLQLHISIGGRTMALFNRLKADGWCVGHDNTYKTITLSELGETASADHERLFLTGATCTARAVEMRSPCGKYYVMLVSSRTDGAFNRACTPLYAAGWRFGVLSKKRRKVGVKDALQMTAIN